MKVAQSCPTLYDAMDMVHGILQARILEWAPVPFSRGLFPTQGSNPGLPHCRWILYQLSHQESPRVLEWVAYLFSSWSSWPRNRTGGLLHCRWILYQLSYEGSPKLETKNVCLKKKLYFLKYLLHPTVHLKLYTMFVTRKKNVRWNHYIWFNWIFVISIIYQWFEHFVGKY